jgi:hypothetical protein
MVGLAAAKKKSDLALNASKAHTGIIQVYTALNDQYSQ